MGQAMAAIGILGLLLTGCRPPDVSGVWELTIPGMPGEVNALAVECSFTSPPTLTDTAPSVAPRLTVRQTADSITAELTPVVVACATSTGTGLIGTTRTLAPDPMGGNVLTDGRMVFPPADHCPDAMTACGTWFLELAVVRTEDGVVGSARILLRETDLALGLRQVVWSAERIGDAPPGLAAVPAAAMPSIPTVALDTAPTPALPTPEPPPAPIAAAPAPAPAYTPTDTGTVHPGMSREEVIAVWGEPLTERGIGPLIYMFYRNGCEADCGTFDVVFLEQNRVVDAIVRASGRTYVTTPNRRVPAPTTTRQ